MLESSPRQGPVDAERFDLPSDPRVAGVEERDQNPLLEIDQIHHRVIRPQRCRVPRDQPCNLVGGGQMSVGQQRLHGTFRITHHLPGAVHPRNSTRTSPPTRPSPLALSTLGGWIDPRTRREPAWTVLRPSVRRRHADRAAWLRVERATSGRRGHLCEHPGRQPLGQSFPRRGIAPSCAPDRSG